MLFNTYSSAVLVLSGLYGSNLGGGLVSPVMSGSENKACELQLVHDLSNSVKTKLRIYLKMTASRCSSNLSDIAGTLCRQIFPSCGKNYLTFLFTPLLHQQLKNDLVWLSAAQVVFTKTRGYCRASQTQTWSHHSLCRKLPLWLLLLLTVLTQWKSTTNQETLYIQKSLFKRCTLCLQLEVDTKAI